MLESGLPLLTSPIPPHPNICQKSYHFHVKKLLLCFHSIFSKRLLFISISKTEYLRVVMRICKQSCFTESDVKETLMKIASTCVGFIMYSLFMLHHLIFYFMCSPSVLDILEFSKILTMKRCVSFSLKFHIILLRKK